MKRVFTATCIAAACMVGLAAQGGSSAGTAQDPSQTGGGRMGGPMTVTGCLRAGDTAGTYMLTNVTGLPGRRGGGDTGGGSGATTTGAGGTTTGAATAGQGAGRAMSIMLNPGSEDLSAHVGHKIEVTGTLSGGRRGGGAGTTAGGTDTTAGSAAGSATGSTGSTAGGTMAGGTAAQGTGRGGMRTMNVTAVKMISADCGGQQ